MKNFRTYLVEKVERKDLSDAAKDTNIRIGAEFEVILPDLFNTATSGYDVEELTNEWNALRKNMRAIMKRIDNLGKEYFEDYFKDFYEDYVEDALDKAEEKASQTIRDLYAGLAPSNHFDNTDAIETQENIIQTIKDIRHDMEYFFKGKDGLDAYSYLLDKIEEIGLDLDGEELLEPTTWAWENMDIRVDMSSGDLDEFYDNVRGDGRSFDDERQEAINNYLMDLGSSDPFDDISDWYSPTEYTNQEEEQDFDDISDEIESWGGWKSAPFKIEGALIGSYHSSTNYAVWRVESDSSLSPGGIEIISPVLELKEGLTIIKDMFEWVKSVNGSTDRSTGFHINLSYKDMMDKLDLLKLMLFMDEGYVEKQFAGRVNSSYALSVTKALGYSVRNLSPKDLDLVADKLDVKSKFGAFIKGLKSPEDKYFGINLQHAKGPRGRIEFRYMGGPGYHRNYQKVETTILRYAYLLRLAADPTYKRKEYILKLMRLFNKWEEMSKNG